MVETVALSKDGKWLVIGGDAGLHLWDVNTGNRLHTFSVRDPVRSVVLSGDGNWLACGLGNNARLYALPSVVLNREQK